MATGVDAGGPAGTSKDSREHKARVPARREREVSARSRHPLILFFGLTMAAMDAAVEIVFRARFQLPLNSGAGG